MNSPALLDAQLGLNSICCRGANVKQAHGHAHTLTRAQNVNVFYVSIFFLVSWATAPVWAFKWKCIQLLSYLLNLICALRHTHTCTHRNRRWVKYFTDCVHMFVCVGERQESKIKRARERVHSVLKTTNWQAQLLERSRAFLYIFLVLFYFSFMHWWERLVSCKSNSEAETLSKCVMNSMPYLSLFKYELF